MPIHFETNTQSYTGQILYSDCLDIHNLQKDETHRPFLNKLAIIPVVESLAGVARFVLSIIHMIGHTLAALLTWNKEHFYHVVKGAAELVRGIIEMIPIIGTIFVLSHDARRPLVERVGHYHCDWTSFLVRIHSKTPSDGTLSPNPSFEDMAAYYIKVSWEGILTPTIDEENSGTQELKFTEKNKEYLTPSTRKTIITSCEDQYKGFVKFKFSTLANDEGFEVTLKESNDHNLNSMDGKLKQMIADSEKFKPLSSKKPNATAKP